MVLLSLVVPCYNEEAAIPIFYEEVLKSIESIIDKIEIEFCFIDDGSSDGSINEIKRLREQDKRIHLFRFRVILEKRRHYLQDWKRQRGIMLPQWMLICRILHIFSLICIALSKMENMIASQRAESLGRESQQYALFSLDYFIS